MLELADRTIRRLSTGLNNLNLRGDGSREPGPDLPDLKFRREDYRRLQGYTRKLPEEHEESKLIADKQK
jgi:hypothetical protein